MPDVICHTCGSEFHVMPYRERKGAPYYCSRPCAHADHGRKTRGEKSGRWKGGPVTKPCHHCGALLTRDAAKFAPYQRAFCGLHCQGSWQKGRTGSAHPCWKGGPKTVPCAWCGKDVARRNHATEHYDRHFCGRRCMGKWRTSERSGEAHWRWKGGDENKAAWSRARRELPGMKERETEKRQRWRRENPYGVRLICARQRARRRAAPGTFTRQQFTARCDLYGWQCYLCGRDLTPEAVSIDHRKPLSRGGSNWPSNLAPACRSCNSRKFRLTPAGYRKRFGAIAGLPIPKGRLP